MPLKADLKHWKREKEKVKIANAYNKFVMEKSFQVGDLVWKMILLRGKP
jgi:hypothetical protein